MKQSLGLYALAALASTAIAAPSKPQAFDPYAYKKNFVFCKATDRSGATPKDIRLELAYIDINPTAKKTLIMLHGWPSLWTTYRNQIQTLGSEYRLIIPEFRGFGDSEHPDDLYSSNTMPDFVDDISCIMDYAGVHAGVCVGNDFGAQVCWEAGRMRPDRFVGIFNIVVPYVSSAGDFVPTEALAHVVPGFGYQVYLQNNSTTAAVEMDADPRSVIRATSQIATSEIPADFLRNQTSFLGPWKVDNEKHNRTEIPFSGIMSQKVENYMVESYKKQGFFNTYNGYQQKNRYETWQFERAQGNYTIPQPTFSLYPKNDPVADWATFATILGSYNFLPNHHNATIATGHWPHEERATEFDAIFRQWIGNVTFPAK
ncbi:Cytosolic epoxide hydrolase 2-like protein [Cladobotryum mycophilum]|uniref:Cytosolic epoxide hydrolase 2-like protein n=1 Tax=Cladobotryum mycophilum TaxID=491253 RepID=A0ABR0SSP6_9HYPO